MPGLVDVQGRSHVGESRLHLRSHAEGRGPGRAQGPQNTQRMSITLVPEFPAYLELQGRAAGKCEERSARNATAVSSTAESGWALALTRSMAG